MSTAVPRRRSTLLPLAPAAAVFLCACGGGEGGDRPVDPGRAKYDADKAHCESISDIEAARKSCMEYRGWPDGRYRR
ncbi:MAG TPA: hypothetical protein VHG93_24730 [Longimicrobium sp.]|nr:hypothetical protein [Longimicrobium sp.]